MLHAAVRHDDDAVSERHRLGLIVRDVHRRHAEAGLERGDVRTHLHAELRVEVRQRLVHEEHRRLADDRPAHRNTLPLAPGKLAGLALEIRLKAEQLGDLEYPFRALLLLDARDTKREADVRLDGQVRVERVVLEDHGHVALLRRQVGDVALSDVVALKLTETCRVAAEPLTATDLAHGPVAAIEALFPVWAIASHDETLAAVIEAAVRARAAGATLVASGSAAAKIPHAAFSLPVPRPPGPAFAPLLSVVAGQLFATALARAKGLDADHPEPLTKVTLAQ